MVSETHSGLKRIDDTPPGLSVVGVYPKRVPWTEAIGIHPFKSCVLFKHILSLHKLHQIHRCQS